MGSHKDVTRTDAHPPGVVGDYMDVSEVAAPATPASGLVRMYAKADGLLYSKDDAGAESALGSGGGSSGFTLIETVTLGGDGVITFDAIPAIHRDLMIVGRVRAVTTAVQTEGIYMRVGETTVDAGNSYSAAGVFEGAGAYGRFDEQAVSRGWVGFAPANDATAGIFGSFELKIYNYADDTVPRNYFGMAAGVTDSAMIPYWANIGGSWQNSANPIDIITLRCNAGFDRDFLAGSHMTLYGLG